MDATRFSENYAYRTDVRQCGRPLNQSRRPKIDASAYSLISEASYKGPGAAGFGRSKSPVMIAILPEEGTLQRCA